ncbi:PrgI family protein [Candidatus Nanogingivalis gingivitcus]|jgi:hypothetical protein cdiviTM7_00587|uniref:PrgI family protein n=1 Tax=Candidatus Nanogingivalis gingivitcus TaxID=2171992 RepID=A0ABY0FI27_9BACT|nr:PrgI family protein [Candidatus Nanogingivalis gingivitcus]RYC72469.1 hypothetical protein G6CMJM_00490 [Candidatus Nanogingivalis gingivitcus]
MSVYKVPQDVEAEDKMLGPFNFRQFIYLMVLAGLIFLSIVLFQVYPGLVIIPAPFIMFFGVLAMPLKKDQPMEMYLAAVVSYHIKPNKRMWQPDGVEHLIEISAPIKSNKPNIKDIAHEEAAKRLSYLADIVDTEGWAIKHSVAPSETKIKTEFINESNTMTDMFEGSRIANNIDNMLANKTTERRQQIMQNMNMARNLADFTDYSSEQIQTQTYYVDPKNKYIGNDYVKEQVIETNNPNNYNQFNNVSNYSMNLTPQNNNIQNYPYPQNTEPSYSENIHLQYDPYPSSMNQSTVQPITNTALNPFELAESSPNLQQKITNNSINEEMKRLVSEGKDLSIETLARQANKISSKDSEVDLNNNEEVVISLR